MKTNDSHLRPVLRAILEDFRREHEAEFLQENLEVKARMKAYNQRPEVKARKKAYNQKHKAMSR